MEIYGQFSGVVHTVHKLAENAHNMSASMKIINSLCPGFIDEEQSRILNTLMETCILAKTGSLQNVKY